MTDPLKVAAKMDETFSACGDRWFKEAADMLRKQTDEIDRLRTAIARESRDSLFSGGELAAASKLEDEICDYVERCRTGLRLDGSIRAGVGYIIRKAALPWLSQRPKIIASILSPKP